MNKLFYYLSLLNIFYAFITYYGLKRPNHRNEPIYGQTLSNKFHLVYPHETFTITLPLLIYFLQSGSVIKIGKGYCICGLWDVYHCFWTSLFLALSTITQELFNLLQCCLQ